MKRKLLLGLILLSVQLPASPGDSLFLSPAVHEIRISFTQSDWWNTLLSNYYSGNPQNIDIYIPASVLIDGTPLDSVGVRLKGNASFNSPGMKKPLKLQFDEYISGQRYDGLKSFHLNNNAFDPTEIREKLMLDVLNRHHLPAPRCTFAAVYMNDEYVGLYKIIESIDKKFLSNRFGENDGNLFKGDPNGTLEWKGSNPALYYEDYELKNNSQQNDWSDLLDLVNRINNSGNYFPQQIESRLDVNEYLWALAANNVFVNLDSYLYNPHNYYLYDASQDGKFHWISWDVGLCFGVFPLWFQSRSESLDIFYLPDPPDKVPLNAGLFSYARYKEQYLNAVCTLLHEDFAPQILFPKIDSLANMIRPYVYAEPDSNRMYSTAQFEENLNFGSTDAWFASKIPGLKGFIAQRNAEIESQLCAKGWSCAMGNAAVKTSDPAICIFPNPSPAKVTVYFEFPENNVAVRYRVYDLTGRKVFDFNAVTETGRYDKELDFSALPDGVYVLKTEDLCHETEAKIIIMH